MNVLRPVTLSMSLALWPLAAALAAPGPATSEIDSFAVTELGPGLLLFRPDGPGPLRANSLVIDRGDGEIVVIDSQPSPEAARLLLERIPRFATGRVRYLVLSHAHAEAAGGASAFPSETVVIASSGYRDALDDPEHDFGAEVRALAGERWIEPPRTRPDVVATAAIELDHANRPIVVVPLETVHAAGDLFVELPGADLLYAGGVVFTDGNPYASSATVGTWINALSHLIERGPLRVVGVRGRVVGPDDLRRQRDALAWVQGRVEYGFVERLPLEKIARRVLDDPGLAERLDTLASPSFLPRLVEQVVQEGAEHRRKRGRAIPGEDPAATAEQPE